MERITVETSQHTHTHNMALSPAMSAMSDQSDNVNPQRVPKAKYKSRLCVLFMKGQSCPFGDVCNFAHGEKDLKKRGRKGEDVFRTQLCSTFVRTGSCKYGDTCRYAHSEKDLRPTRRVRLRQLPRRQICKNFTSGQCLWGKNCEFLHVQPGGAALLGDLIGKKRAKKKHTRRASMGLLNSMSQNRRFNLDPGTLDDSAVFLGLVNPLEFVQPRPQMVRRRPFGTLMDDLELSGLGLDDVKSEPMRLPTCQFQAPARSPLDFHASNSWSVPTGYLMNPHVGAAMLTTPMLTTPMLTTPRIEPQIHMTTPRIDTVDRFTPTPPVHHLPSGLFENEGSPSAHGPSEIIRLQGQVENLQLKVHSLQNQLHRYKGQI